MSTLALFDLDNTLVDRQAAFLGWARRFVADRGLDSTAMAFLCELDDDGSAPRERMFDGLRRRYDLPDPTAALIAEYRAFYPTFFEPDPAVNEALGLLRVAGWLIGVVTNGPPSQLEKLVRAGLIDLIDGYCISEEFGVAKPDQRIFEEAIVRCAGSGPVPTTVWMVGDSPVPDIAGGIGAGLQTIWLSRGRDWEPTDFRPDAIAGNLHDAVERILTG